LNKKAFSDFEGRKNLFESVLRYFAGFGFGIHSAQTTIKMLGKIPCATSPLICIEKTVTAPVFQVKAFVPKVIRFCGVREKRVRIYPLSLEKTQKIRIHIKL
jgi:hypothetical protein